MEPRGAFLASAPANARAVLDEDAEEEEADEEASEHGFFITSITWSAKRKVSPYQIVEFEAGFEEPAPGRGLPVQRARLEHCLP